MLAAISIAVVPCFSRVCARDVATPGWGPNDLCWRPTVRAQLECALVRLRDADPGPRTRVFRMAHAGIWLALYRRQTDSAAAARFNDALRALATSAPNSDQLLNDIINSAEGKPTL